MVLLLLLLDVAALARLQRLPAASSPAQTQPREAPDDDARSHDAADTDADLGAVAQITAAVTGRPGRLRLPPRRAVARPVHQRAPLVVIAAARPVLAPVLRRRAPVRRGRQRRAGAVRPRRHRDGEDAAAVGAALRVVPAAAAAQARGAPVLARARAAARAAGRGERGRRRRRRPRSRDGRRRRRDGAEVAVAAAGALVEAVGADGAAFGVAVAVDVAVARVLAALAAEADVLAWCRMGLSVVVAEWAAN